MTKKFMIFIGVALFFVAGGSLIHAAQKADGKEIAAKEKAAWEKIQKLTNTQMSPLNEGEQAEGEGGKLSEGQAVDFQKRVVAVMHEIMTAADAFRKNYPQSAHMEEDLRILTATSISLASAPDELKIDPAIKKKAEQIKGEIMARKDLPASVARMVAENKISKMELSLEDQAGPDVKARIKEILLKQQAILGEHHKKYPKDAEIGALYLKVAELAETTDFMVIARDLLNEMVGFGKGDEKTEAEKRLKHLNLIGKPLDLKFTAIDGRKVDLAALKGKVVLIDFWATWCPGCVEAIPDVKKMYANYHDKGLEVVGINLDEDMSKLKAYVKKEGLVWPQYFDGKKWENLISTSYGIDTIPAMWLVGKDGNVATLNAEENLDDNVKTLLGGGKLK